MRALLTIPINGQEPPTEFRIWAFGIVETTQGPFEFNRGSADAVMHAWGDYGNDLSIDYGHAVPNQRPDQPAAGWFSLEVRDDGLWAVNVEWTPRAAQHIRDREYRYFSPWLDYDEDTREILELHNIALTNVPATKRMTPLIADKTGTTSVKEDIVNSNKNSHPAPSVQAALGLASDTSEAQVVTEALGLRTFGQALLDLTGAADRDAALGTIQAWKAGATQTATLQAKVDELQTAAEKVERDALIDKALEDRKLTPAQAAEGAFARTVPLATLQAFLASAPRVIPGESAGEPAGQKPLSWATLSGPEKAHLYQNDPETYLSLRKAALGY